MTESRKPNTGLFIGLAVAVALFVTVFVVIAQYAGAVALGTESESQIQATYSNNENILANYTQRIGDMAQVPKMQRDALKDVLRTAFGDQGRAGAQSAVQFVKEAYPGTLDNKLYTRLQEEMASGRKDFQDNQTKLIDQKRVYQNNLNYLFKGSLLRMAGFPKINLAEYKVITSSSARKSFDTGVDDGLQLTQ